MKTSFMFHKKKKPLLVKNIFKKTNKVLLTNTSAWKNISTCFAKINNTAKYKIGNMKIGKEWSLLKLGFSKINSKISFLRLVVDHVDIIIPSNCDLNLQSPYYCLTTTVKLRESVSQIYIFRSNSKEIRF